MIEILSGINHAIMAASSAVNCPRGGGTTCQTGLPTTSTTDAISKGLGILFGVVAVVSVLMVAIGGIQFIMSQGDPQAAGRARMTIVYAALGLVISISAEAIVAFVLGKF